MTTDKTTVSTEDDTLPGGVPDLYDFDLTAAGDRGASMQLKHPTSGRPLGIYFHVVGADGKTFREAYRRVMDLSAGETRKVEAPIIERRAAETVAALILDWWFIDSEGKKYEGRIPWNGGLLYFNTENAVNVLLARVWIRQQIDQFSSERNNFFSDSVSA